MTPSWVIALGRHGLSHWLYSQNQWWFDMDWTIKNKGHWNVNHDTRNWFENNAFGNVVCKIAVIECGPQCVNAWKGTGLIYKEVWFFSGPNISWHGSFPHPSLLAHQSRLDSLHKEPVMHNFDVFFIIWNIMAFMWHHCYVIWFSSIHY